MRNCMYLLRFVWRDCKGCKLCLKEKIFLLSSALFSLIISKDGFSFSQLLWLCLRKVFSGYIDYPRKRVFCLRCVRA